MTTSEDATSRHATANGDRIPWSQLIAYGMGGIIPIALFNIAGQLMVLLGNISLGLSAFWLGTIMIIPRLWDAVSDPVMGHVSDNTRSRWGRRRPFILVGGIAVAVSFVAMWWVPRGESVSALFASDAAYNWFQLGSILAGLLVFFTACTIFEIPHGALGMEMSSDYHERTRLFSAKSFMGNLFAMGTPWLLYLAGRDMFKGPGGDLADGMRYVALFVAAALIPMSWWWFLALKEPGFAFAKKQQKSAFWVDMRTTLSNKTFLNLVLTIFTLAMGFNFVSLFGYYISIFYLFGGDTVAAGTLLGINGTVWAITGLVAVFPLNWLSRRLGKNKTLVIAILFMCVAQLSKIICYDPEHPYLVLIPTVLLSAGMLMFFTLGASMVGDVCDEDELQTGTRSEGSYYSVYWWFIKMGTAFASFVTGVLLVLTHFDEQQTVMVDTLHGHIAVLKSEAERWKEEDMALDYRTRRLDEQMANAVSSTEEFEKHLQERRQAQPDQAQHANRLVRQLTEIRAQVGELQERSGRLVATPAELIDETEALLRKATLLRQQSPKTLFRLRIVEIGLPLITSVFSILLILRYPLTEARSYEIKKLLKARHAELAD
jgi:GPH family glycoside/pentoside/hexuronide:cation symporter